MEDQALSSLMSWIKNPKVCLWLRRPNLVFHLVMSIKEVEIFGFKDEICPCESVSYCYIIFNHKTMQQ